MLIRSVVQWGWIWEAKENIRNASSILAPCFWFLLHSFVIPYRTSDSTVWLTVEWVNVFHVWRLNVATPSSEDERRVRCVNKMPNENMHIQINVVFCAFIVCVESTAWLSHHLHDIYLWTMTLSKHWKLNDWALSTEHTKTREHFLEFWANIFFFIFRSIFCTRRARGVPEKGSDQIAGDTQQTWRFYIRRLTTFLSCMSLLLRCIR